MNLKIISFDIQGTVTSSDFSNEFWIELLPNLYAKHKDIPLADAKKELSLQFKNFGKYDLRYYSVKHWLTKMKINLPLLELTSKMKNKPIVFADALTLTDQLNHDYKIIAISSTTHDFLDLELGENTQIFSKIYSSIDDYGFAGKPIELYQKISQELGVEPEQILHIGDDPEMDVQNPSRAGWNTFFFDPKKSRDFSISRLKEKLSL